MRAGTLSNPDVGAVVGKFFRAAWQKKGTLQVFKISDRPEQQLVKVGGNIVSYVCTPDGRVIHALPAALPPEVYKKELEWAVKAFSTVGGRPAGMAAAHRLRQEHVAKWADGYQGILNPVHALLEQRPLVKAEAIEREVFETILGQTYSPDAPITFEVLSLQELGQKGLLVRRR